MPGNGMFRESNYHVHHGVYHYYAVLKKKERKGKERKGRVGETKVEEGREKKKRKGKRMDCRWAEVQLQFCLFLAVRKLGLWGSYLMYLCLHFLTCEVELVIITIP